MHTHCNVSYFHLILMKIRMLSLCTYHVIACRLDCSSSCHHLGHFVFFLTAMSVQDSAIQCGWGCIAMLMFVVLLCVLDTEFLNIFSKVFAACFTLLASARSCLSIYGLLGQRVTFLSVLSVTGLCAPLRRWKRHNLVRTSSNVRSLPYAPLVLVIPLLILFMPHCTVFPSSLPLDFQLNYFM